MRIITIDNGNSNPHVGIFQDEKKPIIIPLINYKYLDNDFILISDVGLPLLVKPSADLKSLRLPTTFGFNFLGMPVHYANTLGDDRLICAYDTFKKMSGPSKTLIIDSGTFITMDLLDETGFLGGYIFPGVNLFLASYHKGSNLKNFEIKKDFSQIDYLPKTTEEAILGATDIYLVSILESLIKKNSPNKIVLTGGNCVFMKNKIENLNLSKAPLDMNPHLIHSALFEIAQTHFHPKVL